MQMGNSLSAIIAIVDDNAKAVVQSLGTCDCSCCYQKVTEGGLIRGRGFCYSRDYLARDNKNMAGRLGRNITKSDTHLITMDNVGRYLTCDYFFKESGHGPGRIIPWSWESSRESGLEEPAQHSGLGG